MQIGLNKKIENIALALQEKNIFLSGSFALYYQGIDFKREAHDVDFVYDGDVTDIYEYVEKTFIEIGGAKKHNFIYEQTDYSSSEYLTGCLIDNIVFEIRYASDISTVCVDGILMQRSTQILNKKIEYATSNSTTRDKHINDLQSVGIGIIKYVEAHNLLTVATDNFQIEQNRKNMIMGTFLLDQYNFKVRCVRSGQVARYGDSVCEYHITSPLNIQQVEALAREKIHKFKNVVRKGTDFSGISNWPWGLEPYYSLNNNKGVYILQICEPYTD